MTHRSAKQRLPDVAGKTFAVTYPDGHSEIVSAMSQAELARRLTDKSIPVEAVRAAVSLCWHQNADLRLRTANLHVVYKGDLRLVAPVEPTFAKPGRIRTERPRTVSQRAVVEAAVRPAEPALFSSDL